MKHLHEPAIQTGRAIVLAHGAGSDANSPLLVCVANEFARRGIATLRFDLAFREERPKGPPHPSFAARDRQSILAAIQHLRDLRYGTIFAGGHSYGGRQASMLAAEQHELVSGLLLLSYPLHPPRQPERLRTAHFAQLQTRALFVHGTKDPFGTPEELRAAIPANAEMMLIEGAGHELRPVVRNADSVVERFLAYCSMSGD